MDTEKGQEMKQWEEIKSKTGHMRVRFQNKTRNHKNHDKFSVFKRLIATFNVWKVRS